MALLSSNSHLWCLLLQSEGENKQMLCHFLDIFLIWLVFCICVSMNMFVCMCWFFTKVIRDTQIDNYAFRVVSDLWSVQCWFTLAKLLSFFFPGSYIWKVFILMQLFMKITVSRLSIFLDARNWSLWLDIGLAWREGTEVAESEKFLQISQ